MSQYTGYIAPIAAGETITWGSWSDAPIGDRTWPITLFPYASGSDYSGSVVEQSNYRVLADDEHVMRRSVLVQGGHGTFGIAYIGQPTRPIRDILNRLDNYPLLDEDEHSSLEMEIEQREWAAWGRDDFIQEVLAHWGMAEESFPPNLADQTWHAFGEHNGDCGRIFEAPDSCRFFIKEAITWLEDKRQIADYLVLGHIEWRNQELLAIATDAAIEEREAESEKILREIPGAVLVRIAGGEP